MSTATSAIVESARIVKWYTELLLKDIKPGTAARLANGVKSNHPVWVLGHLSIYFDDMLNLIVRPELVKPREGWRALFDGKTVCHDDLRGDKFPPLEEVAAYYFERIDTTIAAVAETSDAVLGAPNPDPDMRDYWPTVGGFLNFMLSAHTMGHLGQISAWRRHMGLGEAMNF